MLAGIATASRVGAAGLGLSGRGALRLGLSGRGALRLRLSWGRNRLSRGLDGRNVNASRASGNNGSSGVTDWAVGDFRSAAGNNKSLCSVQSRCDVSASWGRRRSRSGGGRRRGVLLGDRADSG